MEDSRNIIKAIDALTLKAGGEVVDSKNITEAIDNLRAVYNGSAIGIDDTLTKEGLAADAKAVGDLFSRVAVAPAPVQIGSTYQIPESILKYKFVVIFIGRYGWGDCITIPVDVIKSGLFTGGTKITTGSNGMTDRYYVFNISTGGLLTIKTESTATDAANIRVYGFGKSDD